MRGRAERVGPRKVERAERVGPSQSRTCACCRRLLSSPRPQGEASARPRKNQRRSFPPQAVQLRGFALPARTAIAAKTPQKAQRELEDLQFVLKARNGDGAAMDALLRRYTSFVRLKASSYFLAGGDGEDLVQEGLIGLYKAVRDFRPDKETSFRSFAELCVTRQIITAIKTATRFKHAPLNTYVSFGHTPAGQEGDGDCTLGDALPGSRVDDPSLRVISTEELQSLVFCLGNTLSTLEADALRMYLEGSSYEQMAEELECDTKTIDNALQRVKRKVITHQRSRQVLH